MTWMTEPSSTCQQALFVLRRAPGGRAHTVYHKPSIRTAEEARRPPPTNITSWVCHNSVKDVPSRQLTVPACTPSHTAINQSKPVNAGEQQLLKTTVVTTEKANEKWVFINVSIQYNFLLGTLQVCKSSCWVTFHSSFSFLYQLKMLMYSLLRSIMNSSWQIMGEVHNAWRNEMWK